METHICPQCSKECAYKHGIMCTIQGCIKDGTSNTSNIFSDMFKIDGSRNSNLDALRKIFGMS